MSHINCNHLYYSWHIYEEGSVVGVAEALYLTPQIIIRQVRALEERLQGKLLKRRGRGLEPGELGELVYHYADRMFTLSREMLDIVNYRKESDLSFDAGVADTLSKRLVSSVLNAAVVGDGQIHLRCFESTHEMLLKQLSQHKLDVITSDCSIDSTQQEGLFSMKISECGVSFWCTNPLPGKPFPVCLEERRLLILGRHSTLGRKPLNWFNSQDLNAEILGGFDDVVLMKAFGATHNAISITPSLYANDFYNSNSVVEIGRVENVMGEYHTIFAERMIQHPVVRRICSTDYSALFTPASK